MNQFSSEAKHVPERCPDCGGPAMVECVWHAGPCPEGHACPCDPAKGHEVVGALLVRRLLRKSKHGATLSPEAVTALLAAWAEMEARAESAERDVGRLSESLAATRREADRASEDRDYWRTQATNLVKGGRTGSASPRAKSS